MHFLFDFLIFLKRQNSNYNVLNLSAQLAYRILLAFIPFAMLLYNFLNWFSSKLNAEIIQGIHLFFPTFTDVFIGTATNTTSSIPTSPYANIVFGFFILYASVCAVRSLILTINKVMHLPEKRNYFMIWGVSCLYLVMFILFILVVLTLYLLTQHISTTFFLSLNWSELFISFWRIFTLIYITAIVILLLTGVYMFTPTKHLSFFTALPGAVFVGLGWFLALYLYQFFIGTHLNLADFTTSFEGPFSAIIFIYILCVILCFGCIINLFFIQRLEDGHES